MPLPLATAGWSAVVWRQSILAKHPFCRDERMSRWTAHEKITLSFRAGLCFFFTCCTDHDISHGLLSKIEDIGSTGEKV